MIHVERAPEPADFDARVRKRGKEALLELIGSPRAHPHLGPKRKKIADRVADLPGEALPPFWTAALPDMREAYHDTCAYLAMYIDPATGVDTVDHFKPKSRHPRLAYEWDNYRLASHQVNTDKGEHEDVLDPFEIEDGWFVLDLLTFEVSAAEGLDGATSAAVNASIAQLKLNEPTYRAARARYADLYLGLKTAPDDPDEPLPLKWLVRQCPFVARELQRQRRLRPGDALAARRRRA